MSEGCVKNLKNKKGKERIKGETESSIQAEEARNKMTKVDMYNCRERSWLDGDKG